MMKKQIGIIGMGYLGSRLANSIKNNHLVIGLTRSSSPDIDGVQHVNINLNDELYDHDIWESDILVLSYPPSKVEGYAAVTKRIQDKFLKKIIMISSTSAYGVTQGNVDEATPPSGKNSIVEAENAIKGSDLNYLLRLGGIVGEGRHPWNYLEGRSIEHDEYLHLVHVDDCIKAIKWLIENDSPQKIFNIINSQRILKSDFYQHKCQQAPTYGKLLENAKCISNEKSLSVMNLGYKSL